MRIVKNNLFPFIIIVIISLILITPQLVTGNIIMGSDVIFHFNRFFETKMQIQTGFFSYFISIFGFDSSARIVNAFYGPLMAYAHGLILLISKNWFRYQIFSNIVLYILAGTDMFVLLKTISKKITFSLSLSVIFLTTFSIQYWVQRQGFTSWAVAFLPLCMLPLRELVEHKRLNWLLVGPMVALLIQIHVFTSLQLVIIYGVFFIVAVINANNPQRYTLFINLFKSILVFLLLSMNVIYSYIHLYSNNIIAAPFVNKNMESTAINSGTLYWIVSPYSLLVIFILFVSLYITKRNKSILLRTLFYIIIVHLLLSTTIIPWNDLIANNNSIARIIQFPFRFFVPLAVLLFYGFAIVCADLKIINGVLSKQLLVLATLSVAQIMYVNYNQLFYWDTDQLSYYSKVNSILDDDKDAIRESIHSEDLSKFLNLWKKTTPDYVPLTKRTDEGNYFSYGKYIINAEKIFNKEIRGENFIYTWDSSDNSKIHVPIFKYKNTQLILNGTKLKDNEVNLTQIGTIKIQQREGKNSLKIYYDSPPFFKLITYLSFSCWIILICYFLLRIFLI